MCKMRVLGSSELFHRHITCIVVGIGFFQNKTQTKGTMSFVYFFFSSPKCLPCLLFRVIFKHNKKKPYKNLMRYIKKKKELMQLNYTGRYRQRLGVIVVV